MRIEYFRQQWLKLCFINKVLVRSARVLKTSLVVNATNKIPSRNPRRFIRNRFWVDHLSISSRAQFSINKENF